MDAVKKIHQIWLSGEAIPAQYQKWSEGWKKIHPDFEYILWDAEKVKEFELYNQLKDKCSSWAQKSDVLRYCILERYGGIYADMDYECYKNFSPLMEANECFFGYHDPREEQIGIELLYSIPGHPIFKIILDYLPKCDFETLASTGTGPHFFTIFVQAFPFKGFKCYPHSYFYPYYYDEFFSAKKVFPHTYGAHHWHGKWLGWFWHLDNFLTKCMNEWSVSRPFFALLKKLLNLITRLRSEKDFFKNWQKRQSVLSEFKRRFKRLAGDQNASIVSVGVSANMSMHAKQIFADNVGVSQISRVEAPYVFVPAIRDQLANAGKKLLRGQGVSKSFFEFLVKPNIKQVDIEVSSFENILKKHGLAKVDALQVSARGNDRAVLMKFPFNQTRPLLIEFKIKDLDEAEIEDCLQMLGQLNYECGCIDADMKCILRGVA